MSVQGRGYSRLITGLKIVLPMAALGVLATIFLFPGEMDPSRALPYATVDVEELTRDPRLGAPRFASVTEDGAALTVTARTVRATPGSSSGWLTAEEIVVTLEEDAAELSTIIARSAALDRTSGLLRLEGDVQLASAAGFVMELDTLVAATDRSWMEGAGPIEAHGPPGQITAGAMLWRIAGAEGAPARSDAAVEGARPGDHLLVFTGGVKLIYLPQERE